MNRTRTLHAGIATLAVTGPLLLWSAPALADTFEVGPGKPYSSLGDIVDLVGPGDVVEVQGDATYPGGVVFQSSGTSGEPVVVRGIRVNGKRPRIQGGGDNTVEFYADHYVFEGFEITGGSTRCVFHHGHDITIRDSLVHDCPGHGILGADSDSGSLTLEYVEVHSAGDGTTRHPIYIATDESAHPGSVFRMQHCYVHDGHGGNNVKTRAERNEIYYNWIEGATYHELELIGPDGQDPGLAREDSDVVGNVFRKTNGTFVVRVGGDGTGDTDGRYRFLNNTFILNDGSSAAFRVMDGIESLEVGNNVFYRVGGGGVEVVADSAASWVDGALVVGLNNWMPEGSTGLTGDWTGTITGDDPGFVDAGALDFRPAPGGALVDVGIADLPGVPGHPFPAPLAAPAFEPPMGGIQALGTASVRPASGPRDLGAYEYAGPSNPDPSSSSSSSGGGSSGSATGGGSGSGAGGSGAGATTGVSASSTSSAAATSGSGAGGDGFLSDDEPSGGDPEGSIGCRSSGASSSSGAGGALALVGLALVVARRRASAALAER